MTLVYLATLYPLHILDAMASYGGERRVSGGHRKGSMNDSCSPPSEAKAVMAQILSIWVRNRRHAILSKEALRFELDGVWIY